MFRCYWQDLPRRAGRLAGAIVSLAKIKELRQVGAWLHSLAAGAFDLAAGPEVAQLLLRLLTQTRPLTAEQIASASATLGDQAIRYQDVRIAQGGFLRIAFRLNKTRAFATWHTVNLPAGQERNLPLLVHELTHVYQFERVGSAYIGQGLWAQARLGPKAYDYGGPEGLRAARAAGMRYCDYNREQQGQIAQDYCRLLRNGRDTSAYVLFIMELRAGIL